MFHALDVDQDTAASAFQVTRPPRLCYVTFDITLFFLTFPRSKAQRIYLISIPPTPEAAPLANIRTPSGQRVTSGTKSRLLSIPRTLQLTQGEQNSAGKQ